MADIDSYGSRARQSPSTVRRNIAKPRRRVARPKVRREDQSNSYRFESPRRSRGKTRYSSRRGDNEGRRGAINRRAGRRSTTPTKTAPQPPRPPTAKIVKPPVKPPAPPTVDKYLSGDATYQRQLAAYNKALADFQADQGIATTDYNTGYANTRRDIGLARADATEDLRNDFASRGMLQSGLYGQDLGELNTEYTNQYTDLDKQRTSFLDQLAQELIKYKGEQGTQSANARAEAIRRRSEKYGL